MAKKLLSMLLALSMMLTVIAACNNEPVDPVADPNDQQQEENQGNEGEEMVSDVLNLVVDGVSDYVIVRGENAYISEVTASTELQSYIKQISGVEIPIVTDATAPVEKEIVVGKTNREADGEFDREELGDDGLVIKTNGKKLFLVGGEQRGTLYAVYTFLEEYLGCRFYTGDVEKVPAQTTISLDQITEDKQIPVFENRDMTWNVYSVGAVNNAAVKRKLNGHYASYGDANAEANGGYRMYTWFVHTLKHLVSYDAYHQEHPEYFTVTPDVYYSPTSNGDNCGQLCLTNPEVLAISIETVRNTLRNNPNTSIISISQNDNQNYCKCDECMKVWAEEGESHAGVLLRFVNAIATALKDEFPNVKFDTLAYNYTRNVPAVTVPAENVIVRLCTIECCFSHPLGTCPDVSKSKDITKDIAEDIQDWGKITNNSIYIWDYTPNFSHYAVIQPNFNTIRENIRFFAENNAIGIFQEGHYTSESFEFGDLRAYLLAKLYWNPYMSEEEYNYHIKDFLQYNYGAGWEYLLQYINLAQEVSDDNHFGIGFDPVEVLFDGGTVVVHDSMSVPEDLTEDMIRNYESVDWTQYWNFYKDIACDLTLLTEGERLFALAYEAAETEAEKARIDKISLQLTYLRSCYLGERLSVGNSAIGRALSIYFREHSDEFTADEKRELRTQIIKLANEQAMAEYAEFNRNMLLEMNKYGAPEVHINKYQIDEARIETLNLGNKPAEWYE